MRGYLTAYWTLIRYGSLRYLRAALQLILPPLVTSALYFTIFGKIIGNHIDNMGHISYIEFIAPGLIMMSIITTSFNGTLGFVFFSKFSKQIEEIVIAPIPAPLMLAGLTTVGILRGLLNGLLVTLVAVFFVPITFQHALIAVITAILTSCLFSLAAFTNAIFAKKWDDIAIAPTFIIAPITYLGGIFFSIQELPSFWQKVALWNPMLYVVNTFRYGMIGVSDTPVTHAILIIIGCIVGLFLFNWYLLYRGIGIRS